MLILLLLAAAAIYSGEVVNVTTSKTLGEYLCPQNRTIPPNTDVIISVPLLHLKKHDEQFCLIKNTTNVTISSSDELMKSRSGYSTVVCESNSGFGFFNVTGLTLRSVYFKNCINIVPPMAVKYINESDQFLYYNNVTATLLFNHCCDLTLSQVFTNGLSECAVLTVYYGIIGANLCGTTDVRLLSKHEWEDDQSYFHQIPVLIYYTDSPVSQLFSKYELHMQSDVIEACTSNTFHIVEDQTFNWPHPDRIPILSPSGFALYLTQQNFDVNVSVNISSLRPDWYTVYVILAFINSVTQSKVVFQSKPSELCEHEFHPKPDSDVGLNPVSVDVVFYETPIFHRSSSTIFSPITVQNVAFFGSLESQLSIRKITKMLSHEVVLANLSWCHAKLLTLDSLLHAQNSNLEKGNGEIHLKIVNISMHDNTGYNDADDSFGISRNKFINFIHTDYVQMSGVNYFARNFGGSVIKAVSSKLSVTGNLTVNNGSAYHGGGIRLDSTSTLIFKEPLVAAFSHNSAIEGSAMYAPNNDIEELQSGIQISPSEVYSLENISDIGIHLIFTNNTCGGTFQRSFYAPYFSAEGIIVAGLYPELKLLFTTTTWDFKRSQFAGTTLIDSLLSNVFDLDKYSSLVNGVCVQPYDKPPWRCGYIDPVISNRSMVLYEYVVYPGEIAFSILNTNNNLYYMLSGRYRVDNVVKPVNTTFWSATVISTNTTRYLRYKFYYFSQLMFVAVNNGDYDGFTIMKVQTAPSCPAGFNLTTSGQCDCVLPLSEHGYQCDINAKTVANPPGYWTSFYNRQSIAGNISTVLFSTHCPSGYCNLNRHQEFVLNDSLSDFYFNDNRNGTLCGKCKANFSSVFGSDECQSHCNSLYLLTIPVYAVAGLILVVALFALRLTVATGTINGVIFYANVMGLVMRILIGEHPQVHFKIFHVIISLLNMELGFPLCFYSGMTPAAKVGLQFVFPVYLWSLVLILVVLSKYSVRLTNLIMNSSVQVLATLFFLSFAKIL